MENCQPESLPLDPAGDVTLITNNGTHESRRAFLVSSKLLSLASPVFSKMFSPAFLEGSQIRSDCHPHINLEGDDPMAMEMMFRALHFLCGDIPSSIDPEPLATLAVHCDKYDCNEAMRPWILQWCGGRPEATTSQDFGLLLVAAYMFRAPTFPDIAARAAKHLVPGFAAIWEKHDTLTRLPGSIADALSDQIEMASARLQREVQSVDERLGEQRSVYSMSGLTCNLCDRVHPDTAKKCHPCKNTALVGRHCTAEYRVAECFGVLRRHELWPTIEYFDTSALADIAFRLQCAQTNHKHQCAARGACPLRCVLEQLSDEAQRVLHDILKANHEAVRAWRTEAFRTWRKWGQHIQCNLARQLQRPAGVVRAH